MTTPPAILVTRYAPASGPVMANLFGQTRRRWAIPLALILMGVQSPLGAQRRCSVDWQLRETLRIGSLDGDDALASVNDLAIGPGGEVYVTQQWAGSITVFSPDGKLARSIGRSGGGPGEFGPSPITLSFVGDTLWVGDRSRAQSFGPDGQPLESVTFRVYAPEEASQYVADSPLPDGSFWSQRRIRTSSRYARLGPATGRIAVRRFSAKGAVLDTIAVLDGRDRYVEFDSGASRYVEHPLWKLLPDTWLIGWRDMLTADRSSIVLLGEVREEPGSTSFDLLRIGISGDTLLKRTIPYGPRPFSRELARWWREEFGKFMAGDYTRGLSGWRQRSERDARDAREKARNSLWLPDRHPPVRRVLAGADETIWVLREMLAPEGADRWEVYDHAGSLIGRFTVDEGRSSFSPMFPHLGIRHATRDEVWGTTIDAFHVPYIHKFAVLKDCP